MKSHKHKFRMLLRNAISSVVIMFRLQDLFWVMYNDQPPNAPDNETNGHTKGTVIGSHDGGIWIVHSVPHFPIMDGKGYYYPKTGHRYGQSFLCISLDKEELGQIGK